MGHFVTSFCWLSHFDYKLGKIDTAMSEGSSEDLVSKNATSQSSIGIGFHPPQTPAMFFVQTCEPTDDHTTIHIPMRTNLSYNELGNG